MADTQGQIQDFEKGGGLYVHEVTERDGGWREREMTGARICPAFTDQTSILVPWGHKDTLALIWRPLSEN